ncbi:hypothetical protein [Gluconobacter sphaericus]|uniref:Uncharacterized protein n=1 Tax=Gluconobacter sphaericus NBRC 12467 TaxID=1307951 RepID=A0AA37SKZ9_9PROT|nr:hypothetical protein [Gluconobacter sphaericus]MBF0886904.1 hypothetical protein [Gluconobacter sphaericus]GBR51529.1 hypothetical protein AA12467_0632 [Gluconobacter sphaericus NBRC 12467]GEB43994.1 hypothetical protein GSP01_27760 [Gluconobacter sphaericus NBRC 12467]GLQ86191.1 hypothetical protein GCM10007872_31040 [Gluconobacter sphaericus NBRC 12467]
MFYSKKEENKNNIKIQNNNKNISFDSLEENLKLIFNDCEVLVRDESNILIRVSDLKNDNAINQIKLDSLLFIQNNDDKLGSRIELNTLFGIKFFTDKIKDFYKDCLSKNNEIEFSFISIKEDTDTLSIKNLTNSNDIRYILYLIENYYIEVNSIIENFVSSIEEE